MNMLDVVSLVTLGSGGAMFSSSSLIRSSQCPLQ